MMVNVDSRRRYWANPVDIASFTNSKNSREIYQGFPGSPVICFLCKVYLPRVPDNRRKEILLDHRRSGRHVHVLRVVKNNSICVDYSSRDVQLLCRLCNRNLDYGENVAEHVREAYHRAWVEAIDAVCTSRTLLLNANVVSTAKFMACTSDFAFCNVCSVDIDCTVGAIISHTAEVSHRKRFLDVLLPYTGIFSVDNNTAMWCKVCNLRMPDHFEDVLVHICGSEEHGQWFHDVELRRLHDISSIKYLTDVKESRIQCTRCDLELRSDFSSITAHVHSEPHRLRQKHSNFKSVKSLDDQNFWPLWCHWNYLDVLPYGVPEDDWVAALALRL